MIQRRLSDCRICREESLQKLPWMDTLSSGGLHQAGEDTVGFQSAFRSRSEAYLAKDHHMPERLLRMIISGRYAGTPEEGKEKCSDRGLRDRLGESRQV